MDFNNEKKIYPFKLIIMREIKNNYLIFSMLILISFGTYGQSETEEHEEHHLQHHQIEIFSGIGLIPQSISEENDVQIIAIPIIALDYEYWFNHKIGIGSANDLELSSYVVEHDENEEFEREYAFSTSILFLYEPIKGWKLFAGPGYEFEKSENLALFKIGTEVFKSFEDGWSAGIALIYDIKEVNGFFSFGLAIGKRFGKK